MNQTAMWSFSGSFLMTFQGHCENKKIKKIEWDLTTRFWLCQAPPNFIQVYSTWFKFIKIHLTWLNLNQRYSCLSAFILSSACMQSSGVVVRATGLIPSVCVYMYFVRRTKAKQRESFGARHCFFGLNVGKMLDVSFLICSRLIMFF